MTNMTHAENETSTHAMFLILWTVLTLIMALSLLLGVAAAPSWAEVDTADHGPSGVAQALPDREAVSPSHAVCAIAAPEEIGSAHR